MRNFTLRKFNTLKLFSFILFLMFSFNASAQFYTKHYIAPAPWQYFSKANEIVIATNSVSSVSITIAKSDGTVVTTLSASKGAPAVYRFTPLPKETKAHALNTVLNAAGLIVTGSGPISINLRNVASDALGAEGSEQDIKGNAALTSFGDAGIGIRFRVGYYRDGSLGNFNNYGDQRPIYTVMAITNGTSVTIAGVVTATLNAGQSYLFKAPIGTLVETSNPSVMNTSAAIDTPGGCGDAAFNQIPPEAVLGSEYFIERGKGNDTAEQTTVIATKPNTKVIVDTYSVTGALVSTKTTTLATAGSFFTFLNGVSNTNFSASRVSADNNVVVYSGTAQSCEVDISTIAPVSECGGSKFIETAKFRNYGTGSLPYFGYVLLKDAVSKVYVNGVDIETKTGVNARHQLGTTGWYLINFEDTQIGSPNILSISSDAKLTVSIVQQGGGFSMAGFFSNFAVQPEDPTFSYISGGGCTNSSAMLSTPTGFAPYQWYLNGTAITGATSNTYIATKTGSYSVASTLTCGAQTQSKPVSVTLCTDLGVTKTVDNATPCVGANVEFTVKLSNLGVNNATGVSVNDLLPSGYNFVSSTQSVGTYNSGTGVWSIGDISGGVVATLKIVAKVNASGVYTNTATIPASIPDTNSANNSASISTTPNSLPTASINGTLIACFTTTLTAVTDASSPAYVWYKDNVVISGQTASTLVVTADGDYKFKVTNTVTTCENNSAASTVKVSDTQKPTITCPANVTAVADANSCVATGVVLGNPTTADNCTGTITVTNNAPSSFPIGVTTVTWTAKDVAGNTQTCTQTVTVSDTQKPTITCPANVTAVADANSCVATGVVLGNPTTADNCTGTITVTNNAPSSFPIGVTTVTWTAKDVAGNTQTCTQTVTVSDTQKPTITCPAAATAVADANSCVATGVVLGTPTTADNCIGSITVTNNAPSSFPIGVTTVTWTAKDVAGNTETCTQTVTVSDTQKPTITCPANVTAVADTNSCVATGVVLGTPTTADNCTGNITVTNNAPSSFPIGVTTVTWTAKDAAGNTQTCTQTVTVSDTQKPTITCPANVTAVADANSCVATGVALGTPTTADNCIGSITVTNNAPSSFPIGVTTVTWTAKDVAGNTETCTQTVKVVGPIKANDDIVYSFNGFSGGVAILNILSNDLLNCSAVVSNDVNLALTSTLPSVLTFNVTNGSVTVNPQTPGGTYSFDYTICDKLNTTNCSTASVIITVVAPTIDAVTETTTEINGNIGGTTTSLINNDILNGSPVVIGTNPGEVTLTGIKVPTGLTLNADGTVIIAANTAAGNYNVEYSICEVTNTTNCDAVISVVVVGKPVIDAVTETTTEINGNIGGTTTSLVNNDTLNGSPVVIGTNPGEVTLTGIKFPTGLTLNADGTVIVAANTSAGNYNVEYSICEVTNTTNCDAVISVVVVGKPAIDAVTETTTEINGNIGGTTTSLINNDTLNGSPVVIGTNPGEVTLTGIKVPTGLTLNADGTVTVDANTAAGNYNVEYSICEVTNTANCDSVTSIIVVGTPVINAVEETTKTEVNGVVGGTTESLVTNDTLNGNPVIIGTKPGNVTLSEVTLPTGFVLNADGTVTVPANTPIGNYSVEYKICEVNNPTNCDSANSVIAVTGHGLKANPDIVTSIVAVNQPQTVVNVFVNDTNNGLQVKADDLNLTVVEADLTGFLTLNPDGTVILGANTPAGNYEIVYQICEKLNPANCSSASIKVEVKAGVINAAPETTTTIVNGAVGGTTETLLANDTLSGLPVVIGKNPGDVKLSSVTLPGGFILNPDGTVTVPVNTPAGNYNLEYQICEINNPTNCDSAISIIVVTNGDLHANTDIIPSVVESKQPQVLVNVFDNDTNNGAAVVPGDLNLTIVTADSTGFFTLSPDGRVTLGANAPAGTYELTYQICEKLNPASCSQALVRVKVNAVTPVTPTRPIVGNNDGEISVDGINGQLEFINILDNDLLNDLPVNASEVVISNTPNPYFEFNSDGTVNVLPNTPGGSYALVYQICEKANSTNCTTATLNVFVEVPSIAIIKTATFNDENKNGFANAGETITYKFKITNTGNVPLFKIMVTDLLPGIVFSGDAIDLDVNESDENSFTAQYKITQTDINFGSVSNQATVQGKSARGIIVVDKSDDTNNTEDKPTVLPLNGCLIEVLNALSPNGDGKNERFLIRGLECYPDNTVEIYNRWGVLVFDIDHYNNDDRAFVGFSAGRTTIKQSEGLPVGTYFYILKYRDSESNQHEKSGYLYINK